MPCSCCSEENIYGTYHNYALCFLCWIEQILVFTTDVVEEDVALIERFM